MEPGTQLDLCVCGAGDRARGLTWQAGPLPLSKPSPRCSFDAAAEWLAAGHCVTVVLGSSPSPGNLMRHNCSVRFIEAMAKPATSSEAGGPYLAIGIEALALGRLHARARLWFVLVGLNFLQVSAQMAPSQSVPGHLDKIAPPPAPSPCFPDLFLDDLPSCDPLFTQPASFLPCLLLNT